MLYTCSKCHHGFEAEDPERCPNCGVEAGLEPAHGIPPAMWLFGVVVVGVLVVAAIFDIVSRGAG